MVDTVTATFIGCYFNPTHRIEEIYEKLSEIISRIAPWKHAFVLGDFNCRIDNECIRGKQLIAYMYTPDPGSFAEKGKEYEQLVTFFVSLQALNATDEFWLISNPSNCAPFDDIIICTRTNNENIMYLFQVKTSQSSKIIADDELQLKQFHNNNGKNIKNTSKLQIDALYEKYPKAIQEILRIIPVQLIPSSLSKVKIIIFTNRPVQENSDILERVTETNQFSASQGEIYEFKREFIKEHSAKDVFNGDRYALQKIFNRITESKMGIDNTTGITGTKNHTDKQFFLQSLLIYANQSDADLNNTSIRQVKDFFNSEDFIVEAIKATYFNCIRNWCKIESEKESLTREYIYKLFMYSTFKNFAISIDDYDEQDCQNYREILKECFDSLWESITNNNLHIGFKHKKYILGKALKDFQDLKSEWEKVEMMVTKCIEQERMEGGCEISEQERMKQSTGLTRIEADLLKAVVQQRKEYAEIICNDDLKQTNNKKQLEYYIGFLLGKLPLIVQDFNLNLKLQDLKIIFIDSNICERQGDWLRIDESVRNEMNQITVTTISHQSFKVEDIINGISSEASVYDVLNLIIDSHNQENNDNEILIERKINRIFLDKGIFSDDNHTNELFIINTMLMKDQFIAWSGVNEKNILPFFDYDEIICYLEQENFTEYRYILTNKNIVYVKKSRSTNVHLINLFDDDIGSDKEIEIEWIKSNGSVDGIKKFRCNRFCDRIKDEERDEYSSYDCLCCMELEKICNIQNPFIIIAGVPGAGKTKLLKQFAQIAPANDFILSVALTDHYNYYENYESITKSISAEEHLNYFYKKQCKLLNDFFINKISTKNMIILFDAFDEIAPKYTNTVAEIVKKIREANYKIIVTTRSVLKKRVEDLFETFAFSLNLFYEKDQENYLDAYYKHRKPILSEDTFSEIVGYNKPSDEEFCKVPVNLHLIADVIYNDIKQNGLKNKREYKLDELKLYERFINYRMGVYSQKIKNTNISQSSILSYHKYCSIKLLFNNLPIYEIIRTFLDIKLEDYFKNFKEGNDKVGILIEDVDEIIMIHRTVAEYLAAEWLLEECNILIPINYSSFSQATKKFAQEIIKIIFPQIYVTEVVEHSNNDNFPVVRSFLNLMINKSEVHKAAWEGDYKLFNQTINSDIQTLYPVNEFNITILLTLILNKTRLYDRYSLEVRQDIIKVVKLYLSNCNNTLPQKKSFQLSVQDYAKQKNVNRPFLKIVIHKTDDKCYIYFNRDFKLWEIFCPENLCDCNVYQLLDALQVVQNNKLSQILQAAIQGNSELIRHFYNKERPLDITYYESKNKWLFDTSRTSITHYSVISGNLELIYYLNEIKLLDFSSYDCVGFSAFHYAIIFNKIDIVKYYLIEGFAINFSTDKPAYTPLQLAAGFCNKEIFDFLLEKDADINCKTEDSSTLLHLCTWINSHIKQESSIAKIEVPNYDERCFDFVILLLKKGLDINAKTRYNTPLINAAYNNNETLIKFLIENSVDVNVTNGLGCTPLHAAAYMQNIEILKLLLAHNADINAVDNKKNSILHYALNDNNKMHFEAIKFLIEKGAHPNAVNVNGITPLHIASCLGFLDELKLFIEHSDVEHINAQDNDGNTALHYAAYWHWDSSIMKYLIKNKADINLSNNRNQTTLDLAIIANHKNIELILKNENGMSKNTTDKEGPEKITNLQTRLYDFRRKIKMEQFIDCFLNYFS